MKKIIIVILVLLVGFLIVSAVTSPKAEETSTVTNPPNSAEGAPEGSIHNLPVPSGVRAARSALAGRLAIPESKILILEALETEWPDACLGIKEEGTMCAQVITPGYNVLLQAVGKEYRYRTNEAGTVVKAENK